MIADPSMVAPGLAFLFFGGLWCSRSVPLLALGLASRKWLPASGLINGSHTELVDTGYGRGGPTFAVVVQYSFRVDDQVFGGHSYTFSRVFPEMSDRAIQRRLDEYDCGDVVTVYFDPRDPTRSVLKPGTGIENYVTVFIGGLIVTFGLVMLWSAFVG